MPQFTFTSPDGRTFDIEGPDGATQEQAQQIFRQHVSTVTATVPVAARGLPADAPDNLTEAGKQLAENMGKATPVSRFGQALQMAIAARLRGIGAPPLEEQW